MKYFYIFVLFGFLLSCSEERERTAAEKIVDKAIENAGGEKYEYAEIDFSFREMKYSSRRENGIFEYTRTTEDSLGISTRDVLTNEGFTRYRNDREVDLHDTTKTKFSNSINSVHYFVQLPFGLNAPAVEKELIGEDSIAGQPYYEIKVTFKQEGGGADHEDEYMYWIHQHDYTVDYLAYRFYVEDGGIRFREAYNPRTVEGLRFVDYENFKLENNWETIDLKNLDDLYEAGELTPVSLIQTEIEEVKISR